MNKPANKCLLDFFLLVFAGTLDTFGLPLLLFVFSFFRLRLYLNSRTLVTTGTEMSLSIRLEDLVPSAS